MDGAVMADTAWILAAFTAVSLMLPGIALYYGGQAGIKHTLNIMMMSFGGFAVVGILWILFGYSAVLGDSVGGLGIIGNPFSDIGLSGLLTPTEGAVPPILFAAFQLLFAGLTIAIVAGGAAGRMKFSAWLLFSALWIVVVYFPIAHWVFAFDGEDTIGGWIANRLEAVDFAGGTAVHMNAGVAALALVLVLGKRAPSNLASRPSSIPLAVLGAGILFFGWFGFNGGSAAGANHVASVAVLNTLVAACAGTLGWMLIERIRKGFPTTLGAVSGMVGALVGITPAAHSVSPLGATLIGFVSGILCFLALSWKTKLGYDDALDVVAIHLVGGIAGTVLIAFIADPAAPAEVAGLFYGGGIELLGKQLVAMGAVFAYSFIVTWLIAKGLDKVMKIRVDDEIEDRGLDLSLHAESAYSFESVK